MMMKRLLFFIKIHDTYYLVAMLDNDFIESSLLLVFEEVEDGNNEKDFIAQEDSTIV